MTNERSSGEVSLRVVCTNKRQKGEVVNEVQISGKIETLDHCISVLVKGC